MSNELLAELNAFRVDRDLAPFKDWRKARHMPMLEAYRAERAAFDAAYVAGGSGNFEASAEELAAQAGRPSNDEVVSYAFNEGVNSAGEPTLGSATGEPKAEEMTIVEAAASADFAGNKVLQEKARELAKAKTYKHVAHYGKSVVEKPVAFIHQFLSDNPGMTRKEAVFALTEGFNINYATARTQYQKWFTANKKA